jgi:hypothetical protein
MHPIHLLLAFQDHRGNLAGVHSAIVDVVLFPVGHSQSIPMSPWSKHIWSI